MCGSVRPLPRAASRAMAGGARPGLGGGSSGGTPGEREHVQEVGDRGLHG